MLGTILRFGALLLTGEDIDFDLDGLEDASESYNTALDAGDGWIASQELDRIDNEVISARNSGVSLDEGEIYRNIGENPPQ